MLSLEDIIKPDNVLCNANARSKKHCMEILSELLVRSIPDIPADDIFSNLVERERLGCTSLNAGVAFPHCRVDGLEDSTAALIKLSDAVDFDCSDGEPVDLVFGLMVPMEVDDRHLAEITSIAEVLANEDLREALRECNTSNELYTTLLGAVQVSPRQDLRAAQTS
ncbi:MAG: PTS sugar transporter subunit IIA [Woeseiaceae bacterium]|nr:PTS sugar transporter subunit IIA [Woeseiaceae bacterium]